MAFAGVEAFFGVAAGFVGTGTYFADSTAGGQDVNCRIDVKQPGAKLSCQCFVLFFCTQTGICVPGIGYLMDSGKQEKILIGTAPDDIVRNSTCVRRTGPAMLIAFAVCLADDKNLIGKGNLLRTAEAVFADGILGNQGFNRFLHIHDQYRIINLSAVFVRRMHHIFGKKRIPLSQIQKEYKSVCYTVANGKAGSGAGAGLRMAAELLIFF